MDNLINEVTNFRMVKGAVDEGTLFGRNEIALENGVRLEIKADPVFHAIYVFQQDEWYHVLGISGNGENVIFEVFDEDGGRLPDNPMIMERYFTEDRPYNQWEPLDLDRLCEIRWLQKYPC